MLYWECWEFSKQQQQQMLLKSYKLKGNKHKHVCFDSYNHKKAFNNECWEKHRKFEYIIVHIFKKYLKLNGKNHYDWKNETIYENVVLSRQIYSSLLANFSG